MGASIALMAVLLRTACLHPSVRVCCRHNTYTICVTFAQTQALFTHRTGGPSAVMSEARPPPWIIGDRARTVVGTARAVGPLGAPGARGPPGAVGTPGAARVPPVRHPPPRPPQRPHLA